ncbi:hypothetical protein [Nonomuraea maritima]|jgi:hypothetical protein
MARPKDPKSPKVVPFDPKKHQDIHNSGGHNQMPPGKQKDHGKGGKK